MKSTGRKNTCLALPTILLPMKSLFLVSRQKKCLPIFWTSYYDNVADVYFYDHDGPVLNKDTRFRFKTFGFPIEAEVIEFEKPAQGQPGRLAWHGWAEGDEDHRLDVVHAWLVEDLPKGRVRILTQESQKGKPAKDLFNSHPDTMNIGHQDWIKGLARTVLQAHKK